MLRQILNDASLDILSENVWLANLLNSALFIDWFICWAGFECRYQPKALVIVSAFGSHIIMLNIKNCTMVSLSLQHLGCNWCKRGHSRSVSWLFLPKELPICISPLCFLIVEVTWGGALSLPRPTNLRYQNIISSPGLQKDSANLPIFSLLTYSNPAFLEGGLLIKALNSSFLSHAVWFICLVYVYFVYVHSVTLFFPLQLFCVLISWSSCDNQTGAQTNLPCHLHGIKPSISPVWLPKL